jgi:hypothetical protein
MATQIEEISQGRFAINLVNAWFKPEFERAGIPFAPHDARYAYGAEWLHIVRDLMAGETVHFNGEHFRIDGFKIRPAGRHRPRPLIYAGGESEPARALAAAAVDVWFLNGQPIEAIKSLIADAASRPRAGAALRYAMSSFVIARPRRAEAVEAHDYAMRLAGTGRAAAAKNAGQRGRRQRHVQIARQWRKTASRHEWRHRRRPGRQLRPGGRTHCAIPCRRHRAFHAAIPAHGNRNDPLRRRSPSARGTAIDRLDSIARVCGLRIIGRKQQSAAGKASEKSNNIGCVSAILFLELGARSQISLRRPGGAGTAT